MKNKDKASSKVEEARINSEFAKIQKILEPERLKQAKPTTKQRFVAGTRNTINILRAIYDKMFCGQLPEKNNKYTIEYLKENPKTDKDIVWIIPGLAMGMRTQWRLGRELIKQGLLPIHTEFIYQDPREEKMEAWIKKAKELQKETGLKNMHKRTDCIIGHSAGAIMTIYISCDKRSSKYGINPVDKNDSLTVQAIAPPIYGISHETFPQRIIQTILGPAENADSLKGRERAIEMYKKKARIPYTVYSGLDDRIVRPCDSYDPHAAKRILIEHPDSTHFGTSGGNPNMNRIFALACLERYKSKMNKTKRSKAEETKNA
jgi:hypothetical protein